LNKYEVGKKFLDIRYPEGGILRTMDNGFVDFIVSMSNMTTAETRGLKQEIFTLGIYIERHVPFLLLSIQSIRFSTDASLNVHKIQTDSVESWLDNYGNAMTLFAVEQTTGVLKAMRLLGVAEELVTLFKDACKNQYHYYKSKEDVEKVIDQVMSSKSTDDMLRLAQFKQYFKR